MHGMTVYRTDRDGDVAVVGSAATGGWRCGGGARAGGRGAPGRRGPGGPSIGFHRSAAVCSVHRGPDEEENTVRKVVLYELMALDGVAEEPATGCSTWTSVFDNLGRGHLRADRRAAGPRHLRLLGRLLADVRRRAVRRLHQRGPEARLHLDAARELPWSGAGAVTGARRPRRAAEGGDRPATRRARDITLAQSLLLAGLVDELRLVVVPTVAHGGRRLFPEGPACRRLDLLARARRPRAALFVHYAARSS